VHASTAKQGIHSSLPLARQMLNHLQESRAPSRRTLLGKTNTMTLNTPPALLLPPALYAEHDILGCGVSLGQLYRLCPLPTSCAPPAYSLGGGLRSRKGPDSVSAPLSNG